MIGTLIMNTTISKINYAEVAYYAFLTTLVVSALIILIMRRLSSDESNPLYNTNTKKSYLFHMRVLTCFLVGLVGVGYFQGVRG